MNYDLKQINKKRKTFTENVVNKFTKRFRIENVFFQSQSNFRTSTCFNLHNQFYKTKFSFHN